MVSKRAWEAYPASYRAREIAILADWIRAGESGSIVGLAGAGKSNLLGFVCHRPEVIGRYLKDSFLKPALVQVDLNNLPGPGLATFYRVILRSLYEAQVQLAAVEESLPPTIESLYRKVEEKTDPFLSQSALREALFLLKERRVRLVLVFDPFDPFCRVATRQVLDNLRGLRDSFKASLSYLIGLRHELAYVRDPAELGELYEIMDTHRCWVGPMAREDARWVVDQVEEATGKSFDEPQIKRLIELTGGYPALLRAASLWLARVSPVPKTETWIEALLVQASLQARLREVWQGLTGEEQLALAELQSLQGQDFSARLRRSYRDILQDQADVLASLQEKQICFLNPEENRLQVFSPLLATYVNQVGLTSSGKIWHRETDDVILKGNINLEAELTPQDRKLLLFFLNNPRKILSKDDIAFALWSDEEIVASDKGINDVRLQKAVSQLRGVLERGETSPRYIQTVRSLGYRFFPEGMPHG